MALDSYNCELCIMQKRETKIRSAIFMEIIVLLAWSVWTTRNDWMFKNVDPLILSCYRKFASEFKDLLLRARARHQQQMEVWLQSL
uniref:Uncharacterized protein n=1 Tax=Setaria viridis TaxID=4556 RepID=A0A4U6U3M3_SETVI|nr:hypothetical protein SEVIR_6G141000v2 [Setaria viridis]